MGLATSEGLGGPAPVMPSEPVRIRISGNGTTSEYCVRGSWESSSSCPAIVRTAKAGQLLCPLGRADLAPSGEQVVNRLRVHLIASFSPLPPICYKVWFRSKSGSLSSPTYGVLVKTNASPAKPTSDGECYCANIGSRRIRKGWPRLSSYLPSADEPGTHKFGNWTTEFCTLDRLERRYWRLRRFRSKPDHVGSFMKRAQPSLWI